MVTSGPILTPGQALIRAVEAAKQQAQQQEIERQRQQQEEARRAAERQIEGIGARSRGSRQDTALLATRTEGPRVTPQQLGQRPTPRVVDLRKETPDDGAFQELVRGFVSGDLDASVLADAGRPASNVFVLSPAETQTAARSQRELETDIAQIEKLTQALERGQRSKPVAERVNIATPLPGQGVAIRLSGRQREILGAIRDAAIGRPVREISQSAEAGLRQQIGTILQKRMPQQQYLEMLADLGWNDVFEKEFFEGRPLQQVIQSTPVDDQGRIQNKALRTYLGRREARREELLAFGAEVGATSFLFSVNLPLKAVIKALAKAPKSSGNKFVKTFTQIIKEERGSLRLPEVQQEYIESLKRGKGRIEPRPIPIKSEAVGVQVETAPARPAIPGKFDPATFDPFRPFAPDVPDDPLRVVRRQRRLTRVIERPSDIPGLTQQRITPSRTPPGPGPRRITPSKPSPTRRPGATPAPERPLRPTSTPSTRPEDSPLALQEDAPEGSPTPEIQQVPSVSRFPEPEKAPATGPAPEKGPEPGPKPTPETTKIDEGEDTAPPRPPRVPGDPDAPQIKLPDPEDDIDPDKRKNRIPVRRKERFARVVAWRQGINFHIKDLLTGSEQITAVEPSGLRPGVTPLQTFTILEYSPEQPENQVFDMGAVKVIVSSTSIRFEKRMRIPGNNSDNIPRSRTVTQRQLDRGIL